MIILFYLSSGLFLGWSLGANDAANVFGTAVGSGMIKFRKAAIIASIFVILGAVLQGAGASETLGKLGSVSTLAAAFTVALAAALSVFWMTRMELPVSTSQAIVGAIIGWNFYTGNPTDFDTLVKIVTTWIAGPVLGGIFAVLLFMLMKYILKRSSIHLLYRDAFIRISLVVIGAFGAYSLGANNIANVMGVFTNAIHLPSINLGFVEINSTEQLFFIGGLAIAVGVITYSQHVMKTIGNTLMPLSPEAAIVVVLAQALVLFIFSSQSLSDAVQSIGLPAIPLVPVSSTQVVIGSIIGIGIYKGGKEIKYNILGSISLGWIATPVVAGVVAFFMLFFVNNVFKQDVGGSRPLISETEKVITDTSRQNVLPSGEVPKVTDTSLIEKPSKEMQEVLTRQTGPYHGYYWIVISVLIIIVIVLSYFLWLHQKKLKKLKANMAAMEEKDLLKIKTLEKNLRERLTLEDDMDKELKFRQNEMVTMAMSIIQKNEFLNDLKKKIIKAKAGIRDLTARDTLNKLSLMISQNLSLDREREKFQMHLDEQNSTFLRKLSEQYPGLTENDKRLAVLLRLNLSSKEIASIQNISPKSVEMNRYRLRKKLKVSPKVNLTDFIREF